MKKTLVLLAAMLFSVVLLVACQSTPPPNSNAKTESPNTESQTTDNTEAKKVAPGEEVLNAGGVRIVYRGMDTSQSMGPWLKFDVENSAADKRTIQTKGVLINGSIEGFPISTDIEPGKTKDAVQTILQSSLEENGIDASGIEKIELKFQIIKTDTWETVQESGTIVINP